MIEESPRLEGDNPIPRAALLFMATVEEARRTNQGPFRAIAPIFRIALEPQRGQLLNIEQAAKALQPILGKHFNEYAIEAFLPHVAELGWLVAERAKRATIYRVPQDLPAFDEEEAIESSQNKLDRIFAAFADFMAKNAPLLTIQIDPVAFQWKFFQWATSLDGADKQALTSHANALAAGEKVTLKQAFLDEPQRFTKIEKT